MRDLLRLRVIDSYGYKISVSENNRFSDMKQLDFTISHDLRDLQSFINSTRSFSIRASLQGGTEFLIALYYVYEDVPECICVHVSIECATYGQCEAGVACSTILGC